MRQIDADKLKEKIEQVKNNYNPNSNAYLDLCSIEDLLNAAPTVNEWIPVSKAMPPEHEEAYDVFNPETGEWDMVNKEIEMESDNVIVTVLNNDGTRDTWFDYTVNGDFGFDDPILAWMPMPEPWEG